MIASLKSDFRKILTVRSTYLMIFFALAFTTVASFYAEGYKGTTGSPASLLDANAIQTIINTNAVIAGLFVSIISILLMCHEYRYNTITYTLTANGSRTRVILSKMIVSASASIVIGFFVSLYGIAAYLVGLAMRGASLPVQNIDTIPNLLSLLLYFGGYGLFGLFIAVIIRSLVGAIAFYFIYPSTIEQLLGALIFKSSDSYLPFRALDSVIGNSTMNPNKAALIVGVYIVIFGIISWITFLKRDAN